MRTGLFLLLIAFLPTAVFLSANREGVDAYSTGNRPAYGVRALYYRFGSNSMDTWLNSIPGLVGRRSEIEAQITRAAVEWSGASYLSITRLDASNWYWSAEYKSSDPDALATSYIFASPTPGSISRVYTRFNTRHTWHLNDGQTPDIFSVSLHEFGHWLSLNDNPTNRYIVPGECTGFNSVMVQGVGFRQALCTDDKEAASIMYGVYPRFEQSQYLGLYQTFPKYSLGVQAYGCGSGVPDYWTYNNSNTPPSQGLRSMRFSGCAVSNGSTGNYAYLKLASADDDGSGQADGQTLPMCGSGCWLHVRQGMKLRWEQNNQFSCKVTLDIEFTNGTSLRDSGLTDNFGVGVHPTQRTCFSNWRSIEVDLSPLAGRIIKHIFVVYDDPGGVGNWRSWFDNVRITY